MKSGHPTNKGICIHTYDFDYDDIDFLVKTMNKLYRLSCTVNTINANRYGINIQGRDLFAMKSIVKPYIIPEMEYKFNPDIMYNYKYNMNKKQFLVINPLYNINKRSIHTKIGNKNIYNEIDI